MPCRPVAQYVVIISAIIMKKELNPFWGAGFGLLLFFVAQKEKRPSSRNHDGHFELQVRKKREKHKGEGESGGDGDLSAFLASFFNS